MKKNSCKILGIDLGGCMSGNSAYVYADITDNRFDIIESFKEPRHKNHEECGRFLQETLTRHNLDVIAIDAPLSLPMPLIDPSAHSLPREGSGEIMNPYLFRYTDYFIYRTFGLRPMPPAGDRIGRLTARAIELLHTNHYRFAFITVNGKEIPIYEVYPRQIAQALRLRDYKHSPAHLYDELGCTPMDTNDEHLLDALLCAYGGCRIFHGRTLLPPEAVEEEGWCFPLI